VFFNFSCRFGEGYYNGFGGKVESGETIEEATIREVCTYSPIDFQHVRILSSSLLTFLNLSA
jgi:NADH pyrophosphatase NudC (nudix superfamily)